MPSNTNRQRGFGALAGSLLGWLRRLAAALRRQPAGRSGSVSSGRGRDGKVVAATRRRPSGSSQPGPRQTAKRPQRRRK